MNKGVEEVLKKLKSKAKYTTTFFLVRIGHLAAFKTKMGILSTSSDELIGTSLLKAKTLFIDFIDRRVEVREKEV